MDWPILRLEIQNARHALMCALDDRNDDLKRMVAAAMDNAIPQIQAQLNDMVLEAAMIAVRKAVGEAAEDAIDKMAEETAAKLAEAVETAIRKKVR